MPHLAEAERTSLDWKLDMIGSSLLFPFTDMAFFPYHTYGSLDFTAFGFILFRYGVREIGLYQQSLHRRYGILYKCSDVERMDRHVAAPFQILGTPLKRLRHSFRSTRFHDELTPAIQIIGISLPSAKPTRTVLSTVRHTWSTISPSEWFCR